MSFVDSAQVRGLRNQLEKQGWQTRVEWELGPGGKGGQVTLVAERGGKVATCGCAFGCGSGGIEPEGLRTWMVLGWRVVMELSQCG